MAAPTYKLTYFDIRGLAELPRLVLTAAGVSFEDDRIPFSKNDDGTFFRGDWDERKKKAPYGQVPLLTVNGTEIAQSSAIIRFIANKHGLAGSNEIEAALIDAGYEAVADIRKAFFTNRGDAAKTAEFWEKTLGEQSANLNKNVAGNPWFQGNKMSYTDIAVYYLFFVLGTENKAAVDKVLSENPKLKAISDAVENDAKIAAYLKARKVTIF